MCLKVIATFCATNSSFQIPIFVGPSEGIVKKFQFPEQPFHGEGGCNGVFHDHKTEINLQEESAALAMIRLSREFEGIATRKFCAQMQNIS